MIRRLLERLRRVSPGHDVVDAADVATFGGLSLACLGITLLWGFATACVVGGAALFWLGTRKP